MKTISFALIPIALIFALTLTPSQLIASENEAPEGVFVSNTSQGKMVGERQMLRGEISASDKTGLALQDTPTHETWLPFDADTRFSGYSKASDIAQGDKVVVTVEEVQGRKVAREVNFVQKSNQIVLEEKSPSDEAPE